MRNTIESSFVDSQSEPYAHRIVRQNVITTQAMTINFTVYPHLG